MHIAEIKNGIVQRVIVVLEDYNGIKPEDWAAQNLGGEWIQTSYNTCEGIHKLGGTPLRKNYAGIGYTYDKTRDAFIPPKPHGSWILDEEKCSWKTPVNRPQDGKLYIWDEETNNWKENK